MSTNSHSTRQLYGAWYNNKSSFGGGAPPGFDGELPDASGFISDLSSIQSAGARATMRITGAPSGYGGGSAFSLNGWKAAFDTARNKTTPQQIGNFNLAGGFVGIMMIDDLAPGGNFTTPPTFSEIDEMARYVKSFWTMCATSARVHGTYLKSIATRSQYSYLDFCWNQWHERFGAVAPWYQTNTNDARSVGLGSMQGFNLLGGGSGITPPWNVPYTPTATQVGMSPQEIDACANAFSQLTYSIGILAWAHQNPAGSSSYWELASIQTALSNCFNKALGKTMGPLNWRGDLPNSSSGTTAGSVNTVAGGWGNMRIGSHYRTGDAASIPLTLPTGIAPNEIIGIIAYSRDNSVQSAVRPSGWVEARVSGNSAQGGDLALFLKPAVGNEGGTIQNVAFTGPGGTAGSIMGQSFSVSGNTTGAGAVLIAAVGSGSSWAAKSDMGPVKGITSTISDSLVLVVAAKANDFNSADPAPMDIMSATTTDGETWTRMFLLNNASGPDSGMFCDYTFTSGLPSITTKSWSQTTLSGTGASGAGVGFMIAFAPLSIVSGQPPVMLELSDWFVSTGSTVSFVVSSTGSTPITYSKVSGPSNATFGASTGAFQWTTASVGTYITLLRAANSFGSDTNSFAVFVSQPGGSSGTTGTSNSAPIIVNPGNKSVAVHDLLSFTVVATDPDSDTVTMTMDPAYAPSGTFVDSATGQFIWIPTVGGIYPVVIVATDGQAESRSTFTVTVGDVPWTSISRTVPNSFIRI